MAKVTSKRQLTLPKAIADQYGIRAGDELDFVPAGDTIRVTPARRCSRGRKLRSVEERLRLFDQATQRQRRREAEPPEVRPATEEKPPQPHELERGWRREDLYTRGLPR